MYFLSTHLPIQVTTFLILLPATQLTSVLNLSIIPDAVGKLPWLVQFLLAILVADLAQYWIHRGLHKMRFMWRFHAIHHSSKALDWIAGSRAHLVEDVVVRGGILIPMMLIFPQSMHVAYLFFVNIHATWAHCNFGPTVKWLEPYLIQPRFHHWHHTSQAGIHRQELRDPLSVDRQDLRNLLPARRTQLAGYLRPAQREDCRPASGGSSSIR